MRSSNTKLKSLTGAMASIGLLAMAGCASVAAGPMGDAFAAAVGIPQMDAFLPYETQVPPGQALEIDGVWKNSMIGKSIRIDRGRAFAVDPWTHALTLKVRPNMVVMKNIRQTGTNTYVADDLPMLSEATMQLLPDGKINVSVASFPPAKYLLLPVVGYEAAPQPYQAAPEYREDTKLAPSGDQASLDDCGLVDVDPNTGELICVDE